MQVVIVGGGINGLLTARELFRGGCQVTVLDQGLLGREASWAGGGIVSPLYPWRYPPAVSALARWAQQAYPDLAAELLEETGIDAEFERSGLLFLDTPDQRDAQVWAAQHDVPLNLLGAADMRQRWPGLPDDVETGVHMPTLAHIRNPRLLKALVASLRQSPQVSLREQTEVVAVHAAVGGLASVDLASGERLQADAIVVCAGAWSARLLARLGLSLPVRPIRGQMLLYQLAPGAVPMMIMRDGHYLIPRRDGLVLCGSTLEDAGFDKTITAAAGATLTQAATCIWPVLSGVEPIRQWAGLRPSSPNGIPFISALPGHAGLWVNAGQFRNGLVLAPASARLLADRMLGRAPAIDPLAYSL